MTTTTRETWASQMGFLFAATGSAVGLGNIWRFPMMVGQNGGAAFLVIYLAAVVLIGLPIMLAELAVGWQTNSSPVRALRQLAPGTAWSLVGLLGVTASLAILSYYGVIASWTLAYTVRVIMGPFREGEAAQSFATFSGNAWLVMSVYAVYAVLTMAVVLGGVQGGIERWSKMLMPSMVFILVLLVIRSLMLPGASEGVQFYLWPDFSEVTAQTVLSALSQAFFSLSIGMGIMITYGSYLPRETNLVRSATWITAADTGIALLAGLAIFPALFTLPGLESAEGPRLMFVVLPSVFATIPGGVLFGAGFFLLLTLAALTSSVSLMEVVVAYLMEERDWSRRKSVVVVGLVGFLVGVPSVLSAGAVQALTRLPKLDVSFLEAMDFVFGKICLTVAGLAICLFVGWRWTTDAATQGIPSADPKAPTWRMWSILIRFLCPVAILLILIGLCLG